MPAGDRTGPEGMGPMSGRGMGYCGGSQTPGLADARGGRGFGRGFGRGRGMGSRARGSGGGRGWRHWFRATGVPGWIRFGGTPTLDQSPDPQAEKQALQNRAEALQAEMDAIKQRLGAIDRNDRSE